MKALKIIYLTTFKVCVLLVLTCSPVYAFDADVTTDQWGTTKGTVNGERYRATATDQWGTTKIKLGDKRIRCKTNSHGRTTCKEY